MNREEGFEDAKESKQGSDTDDDDESKPTGVVTEDVRTLSEYEIQRLVRIKRNRQYLAQLGLAGKEGGGVLGEKKRKARIKRVSKEAPVVRRSSRSRRTMIALGIRGERWVLSGLERWVLSVREQSALLALNL
jgi:hypothetical protein